MGMMQRDREPPRTLSQEWAVFQKWHDRPVLLHVLHLSVLSTVRRSPSHLPPPAPPLLDVPKYGLLYLVSKDDPGKHFNLNWDQPTIRLPLTCKQGCVNSQQLSTEDRGDTGREGKREDQGCESSQGQAAPLQKFCSTWSTTFGGCHSSVLSLLYRQLLVPTMCQTRHGCWKDRMRRSIREPIVKEGRTHRYNPLNPRGNKVRAEGCESTEERNHSFLMKI